ncbi:MAG: DUF2752 domain-containing protein [Acaryochloris sp. RU_4_1]|nr:DUF2752 domain-containing protein [Acaryochloris sp. RU_4_1]
MTHSIAIRGHSLCSRACRKRWGLLGICSAPLLGAIPYGGGYRFPSLACPMLHLTGIPCPTCGMTRSFVAIAQGNWSQAVTFHLFGPVLFALFAIVVVHTAIELRTNHQWITFYTQCIRRRDIQILSIVTYLGYYFFRLLVLGYPDNFENTLSTII